MKKVILMSEEDIRRRIANSFSVDIKNVQLEIYMDSDVCGVGEHYVEKIRATVEVPMNDQR